MNGSMQSLAVRRLPLRLTRDPTHTSARFFWLGSARAGKVIDRVLELDGSRSETRDGPRRRSLKRFSNARHRVGAFIAWSWRGLYLFGEHG